MVIEPVSSKKDRGEDYPAKEPSVEAVYESALRGCPMADQEARFYNSDNHAKGYNNHTKDGNKSVLFHF